MKLRGDTTAIDGFHSTTLGRVLCGLPVIRQRLNTCETGTSKDVASILHDGSWHVTRKFELDGKVGARGELSAQSPRPRHGPKRGLVLVDTASFVCRNPTIAFRGRRT